MITKREAAIISAYTGILLGEFNEFHKYTEEIIGRPIWTHEFANKDLFDEIKKKAKDDFLNLKIEETEEEYNEDEA